VSGFSNLKVPLNPGRPTSVISRSKARLYLILSSGHPVAGFYDHVANFI